MRNEDGGQWRLVQQRVLADDEARQYGLL